MASPARSAPAKYPHRRAARIRSWVAARRRARAERTIREGQMSERAQAADDAEATIVLPTPGRKRSAFAPAIERHAAAADLAALGGLNPLVEAANPILAAVPQIRHALRHPDPAALRARLREQVDGFERSAIAAGIAEGELHTA